MNPKGALFKDTFEHLELKLYVTEGAGTLTGWSYLLYGVLPQAQKARD